MSIFATREPKPDPRVQALVDAVEFLLVEVEAVAQGDADRVHLRNLLGSLRAAMADESKSSA